MIFLIIWPLEQIYIYVELIFYTLISGQDKPYLLPVDNCRQTYSQLSTSLRIIIGKPTDDYVQAKTKGSVTIVYRKKRRKHALKAGNPPA